MAGTSGSAGSDAAVIIAPPQRRRGAGVWPWVLLGLAMWLGVAVSVGKAGLVARLPQPGVQVLTVVLAWALTILFRHVRRLRTWTAIVDLRLLILLHLSRFLGFYFLYLGSQGGLPRDFSVPCGWGEVGVAAGALVLLMRKLYRRWWLVVMWNAVGLAAMLLFVAVGARLSVDDPASMGVMTQLPLSLIPTWLAPILIGSHAAILARMLKTEATASRRQYGVRFRR